MKGVYAMEWADAIGYTVRYVEEHLSDDINLEQLSTDVGIAPFYFQKGFSLLCGMSIMEYVRARRLSVAGTELASGDGKVIDIALKYGYESPDAFTKAFTRFHGMTPKEIKKGNVPLRAFAPLILKISMQGGFLMDYRIIKKDAFTVMGALGHFRYEDAKDVVPAFWKEHYQKGNGKIVCGCYGINIDEKMGNEEFDYLIADNYDPVKEVPDGFVTRQIPSFTWAVFPCKGPMPVALQDVNVKIFSEWLPAMKDYEFAAGYCIEMYTSPADYPKGTLDDNYYAEIWIPVKSKV